jgi:protease-4
MAFLRFLRLVAALLVAQCILFFIGLFLLAGAVAFMAEDTPQIETNSALWLRLTGEVIEYPTLPVLPLVEDEPLSQHALLESLRRAAADTHIDGVLVEIDGADLGWGKATELRGALQRFRKSGKPVWAYAPSYDELGLYIAGACDSIFLPQHGTVLVNGLAAEGLYFRGLFDRYDIRPNFHRIGAYKDAVEPYTRSDMSEPSRRQTEDLLDAIWTEFRTTLATDRKLEAAQVDAALARGLIGAEEAVERGLVDAVRYRADLTDRFAVDDGPPRLVLAEDYAGMRHHQDPAGAPAIAIVHTRGVITGGKHGYDPMFGALLGSSAVVRDLSEAAHDRDVAAIVLRIDSPGGEVVASDVIARAVETAMQSKPVVVSMVDVAASGGYMMAYRASRIVALPTTITGSIGIFSGKLNLAGLANRFGITTDGAARGSAPLLFSSFHDWSAAEESLIARSHWTSYRRWIADIAARRSVEVAAVDSVARGRVFTGTQAITHKLVDETGDLRRAVALARELGEVAAEADERLVHYPKPISLLEALREDRLSLFAAAFERGVRAWWRRPSGSWSLLSF